MGAYKMDIQDRGYPKLQDLTPLLNTEVIPLDRAVEAYKLFHEGSSRKFVIDPHNTTKLASAETSRAKQTRSPTTAPA